MNSRASGLHADADIVRSQRVDPRAGLSAFAPIFSPCRTSGSQRMTPSRSSSRPRARPKPSPALPPRRRRIARR